MSPGEVAAILFGTFGVLVILRVPVAFALGLAATSHEVQVDTPSLARVEWEHIQRVLADAGGNVSEAARALSMHRRSLQRKLAKYPVKR